MARKLDPLVADTLKSFGFGPDACWDCHGTWVVYHRALEQIAAKAGIAFDMPMVLEARGDAKCVALCVTGKFGDKAEWSVGEASPSNNKNAYPYAMAEKRAKDRVILKLIGLHGLVYSEEEFDTNAPRSEPPRVTEHEPSNKTPSLPQTAEAYVKIAKVAINAAKSKQDLTAWWAAEQPNRSKYKLKQNEGPGLDLIMAYHDKKDAFDNSTDLRMAG